jgi:hypothetical protein
MFPQKGLNMKKARCEKTAARQAGPQMVRPPETRRGYDPHSGASNLGALHLVWLLVLASAALARGDQEEGPYTYLVTNGQAVITGFDRRYTGPLHITDALGGYPVTTLGDYAICCCPGLTSVMIPSRVTTIGYRAFYACLGLTNVTIPDSVTNIGDGIFAACRKLLAIGVDPANACYSSSGGVLFDKAMTVLIQYPAGRAKPYTIPDSVTQIAPEAFAWCWGLTDVAIGDRLVTIGDRAFYVCPGLTRLRIPDSVTTIGHEAFGYCS